LQVTDQALIQALLWRQAVLPYLLTISACAVVVMLQAVAMLQPVAQTYLLDNMIDIALDKLTHDLVLIDNDLVLLDGAERVRQHLAIKLKLWVGEWFMDTEFGTPYLSDILGKQVSLAGSVAALKKSISEVDGVQSITRFEFDFNRSARNLDVNFDVQTPYGNLNIIKTPQKTLNELVSETYSSDFVYTEDVLNTLTNTTIPNHNYG
jgi:hypothetical protein